GRAPGTDRPTMLAIRRDAASADSFPQDVLELQGYLSGDSRVAGVQAVPRAEGVVPLYLLGSSLFGARLAARLGLPYAFASHFAPDALHQAVAAYRQEFEPSEQLSEPYVIAGVNVFAAEDREEAEAQRTIAYRNRARAFIKRGQDTGSFTDAQIDAFLASPNGGHLAAMTKYTAVGDGDDVRVFLEEFAASAGADELITAHHAEEIADRVRSVELTARALK